MYRSVNINLIEELDNYNFFEDFTIEDFKAVKDKYEKEYYEMINNDFNESCDDYSNSDQEDY